MDDTPGSRVLPLVLGGDAVLPRCPQLHPQSGDGGGSTSQKQSGETAPP